MFDNLNLWQKLAGISFLTSKFFGLVAMATLLLATKIPSVPITFGSLWAVLLIACFVFCGIAHSRSNIQNERQLYERLKTKYESK